VSNEDRTKWDAKYASVDAAPTKPSQLLTELADMLPASGSALDIAGGAGRNAIWLAQQGLDVTIADISRVGLEIAQQRAATAKVALQTVLLDVDSDPLPNGPWDVILCTHFLHRPLFAIFPKLLKPNGLLVVIHPTATNLERHEKPPARFLLQDGELPTLVTGLEILHYEEGWLAEGRHDAVLVARQGG
jgi:2-polyprenyl-3-methyl-5-hydroxy-6-metoxy-1,4-benzoquinol methylase